MKEENVQHGAIPINPIRRKLRNLIKPKVARGAIFDWNTGYDVRDTIGPIAIKNQGQSSSCGGQAGSYFLEIQRKLQNITEGECSAKSVYAPIAYYGGGTTVTSLENQVGAGGCNLESSVPSYGANRTPLPEYFMTEKSWITSQTSIDALGRAGYTPYDVHVDIDTVASTIASYGACLWEITGQNNGTWLSPTPKPPSNSISSEKWNHFMCLIGAKMINGQKTIIALQSWGENVGDKGIQYFTEEYLNSGYIVDCFTFIYDSKISASISNTSIWATVNRWFSQ